MDHSSNQKLIEQPEGGQLVEAAFPLSKQPVDYQLTIHVNNMLGTYGKDMIKHFKELLQKPELMTETYSSIQIRQLIGHYGVERTRQWFTLIYGWEFKTVIKTSKKVS